MANITVRSIISNRDQQPYVQLEVTDDHGTARVQLTPEDAREQVGHILAAAEAADTDKFLYEFAMSTLGADTHGAIVLINEFREWREKRRFKPQTVIIKQ